MSLVEKDRVEEGERWEGKEGVKECLQFDRERESRERSRWKKRERKQGQKVCRREERERWGVGGRVE